MLKTIQLQRGKTDSIKRFHPWIFSGAIGHMAPGIEEGELVQVVDAEGNFLAIGHFQHGSIAVRILSFTSCEINDGFWQQRLGEAWRLREALGLTVQDAPGNIFRLVHGEGDRLPGLVVDLYGETAVMQAHSYGMHLVRDAIAEALIKISSGRIKNVYYKSETTLPHPEEQMQKFGFLRGNCEDNIAIENGLKFRIDWLRGQKTGFFVDQRENRRLLEQLVKGRRVLNMFCYTGGFSVYALRGGATLVHSVDSSAKAIDLTNINVMQNFPNAVNHEAFAEDAFRFLEHTKTSYDLIILDPPAFAKHKSALHNALKGYTRLNAAAIRSIESGGIIFTFSCSQAVSKEQFRLAIFTAAAQCGRHVRILYQLHQPADHPINIYHPEGEYLKGLVLQVE